MVADLLDMSADGLPDIFNGEVVRYNTEAGFAAATDWSYPLIIIIGPSPLLDPPLVQAAQALPDFVPGLPGPGLPRPWPGPPGGGAPHRLAFNQRIPAPTALPT